MSLMFFPAACRHGACPEEIEVFDDAGYDGGWLTSSQSWLHSPPDDTGYVTSNGTFQAVVLLRCV